MEGSCLRSYIDRKTTFVVNIRVRTLYVENKNSWLFFIYYDGDQPGFDIHTHFALRAFADF